MKTHWEHNPKLPMTIQTLRIWLPSLLIISMAPYLLCSNHTGLLHIMQITLSFSHYSFGIAFTSVWNILSPDSHMACSFTSLRSLPKNNLLREAFRPLSKKRQHHPRLSTLSSHFSLRYLFVSLFITSPPLEIKLTEGRNFILCLAHSNHSENIS